MPREGAMGDFEVTISWNSSDVALSCAGELDLATADRFNEAVELCLSKQPTMMLIDLSDLSFLGSEGLRSLIHASTVATGQGSRLIVRTSEHASRVIALAGLADLIHEEHDLDDEQEEPFIVSEGGGSP
jgi:anti-sigma B factor antagonist